MAFKHVPVLFAETIQGLITKKDGLYVDGTMGGAGHSLGIIEKIYPEGFLIALDQDEDAIKKGQETLAEYQERIKIVQANFADIDRVLDELGIENIDGALIDIGVSSYQLDEAERGFSYQVDAPLDMRMDRSSELMTAADILNTATQEELKDIIYQYGEERWAKRIAEFIIVQRRREPFTYSSQLVQTIKAAIPAEARKNGPHPAKRTFQALRIAVNRELEVLETFLHKVTPRVKKGGRICVITFHSLEDRIVKNVFRDLAKGCICPIDAPICTCGHEKQVKVITRKPIVPSEEEIEKNPRSRSAKLRIAEKI